MRIKSKMQINHLRALLQKNEIASNSELSRELNILLQANKYATQNILSYPTEISPNTYKYLLENHDLNLTLFFHSILTSELTDEHDKLLDLALSYKIDFSNPTILFSHISSEKDLEKCLKHGLKIEAVAKNIILNLINTPDIELTLKQIEILKNVDINQVFTDVLYRRNYSIKNSIEEEILEELINNSSLSPDIVLAYGITFNFTNIVKLALKYNSDLNCKYLDEDFNILTYSLFSQNIGSVNLLLDLGATLEVDTADYCSSIAMAKFDFATQVVKKMSHLYTDQEIYQSIRAAGASEADVRNFFDFYNLIREYNDAISGKASSLSKFELDLLGRNITFNDISEDKNITLTNKYSYNLLHLSILSDQYSLATHLVKDGADINAKTNNNITAIQLLSYKTQFDLKDSTELTELIFDKTENIDIDIGLGETLADILITNENLKDRVIEASKDSLFSLFKNDTELLSLAKDFNKTNIAISHESGFWSTGIWSTARIINKNYPDVKLYLVNNNMLEKGGEAFIRQFDAVINPGGGDSYPTLHEFTKADCPFDMELERHYQNMLEISDQNNIPYLGICAGAQHFSMYHGGTLKPLKGYNKGRHEIKYIEGTHSHFMALTKAQQSNLLKTCNFPEVVFQGDTAHNYAAVNEKLGNNLQLGAMSEDNIAMSYYHNNGIRYATQFHPEHYYNKIDDQNAIHQEAWINNFIELAQMHHDFRVNGGDHPIQIFSDISTRLTECLTNQICIAEDSVASYYHFYN